MITKKDFYHFMMYFLFFFTELHFFSIFTKIDWSVNFFISFNIAILGAAVLKYYKGTMGVTPLVLAICWPAVWFGVSDITAVLYDLEVFSFLAYKFLWPKVKDILEAIDELSQFGF